ncbi:MAG: phosphatase PAP2 family protein [Bacteroidota bacterium]
MNQLSRILSWVFLPLNAPVFALLIAAYIPADTVVGRNEVVYLIPEDWKLLLVLMFGFFSVLIPGLTILFLRYSGAITTVMMDSRKERMIPSFFVNISAIALFYLVHLKDPGSLLPSAVYGLCIGSFATVFICTIITNWWKVSLHAAGMGILSGFLFAYYSGLDYYTFWILPATLIMSGIVMSGRIYLGKHSLAQCLVGYFIGVTALAATVLLFRS